MTRQEMIDAAARWQSDANRHTSFVSGESKKSVFKVESGDLERVKDSLSTYGYFELFMGIHNDQFAPFLQLGKDNVPDYIPGETVLGDQIELVSLSEVPNPYSVYLDDEKIFMCAAGEEGYASTSNQDLAKEESIDQSFYFRKAKASYFGIRTTNLLLKFGSTPTPPGVVNQYQTSWKNLPNSRLPEISNVPDYGTVNSFGFDPVINLTQTHLRLTANQYKTCVDNLIGLCVTLGINYNATDDGRPLLAPIVIYKVNNSTEEMEQITGRKNENVYYHMEEIGSPCPPTCN